MLMIAIHWAIIGKKTHSKRYIQQRKKEDGRRGRDIFYFGVSFWLTIFNIKLQHNNPHPKLTMPQSSLHCTHPFSRYFPLSPDCMGICTKSKHQCVCRHFGEQTHILLSFVVVLCHHRFFVPCSYLNGLTVHLFRRLYVSSLWIISFVNYDIYFVVFCLLLPIHEEKQSLSIDAKIDHLAK